MENSTSQQSEDIYKNELSFNHQNPEKVDPSLLGDLPYSLIGAITFEYSQAALGLGTGLLIAPDLVLTAAHNVYSFEYRKYFNNFRFYLGQSGLLSSSYGVEKVFVPEPFKNKDNATHDYALLLLSERTPVQKFIELRGTFDQKKKGQEILLFGYTNIDSKGLNTGSPERLYQWGLTKETDSINEIRRDKGQIIYRISTFEGQSGAAILLRDSDSALSVIGVHKGGVLTPVNNSKADWFNAGRLLTEELIEELKRETQKMKKESQGQLFQRGNQLYNSGKFSEALTSYRRALEIDPTNAATHQNMGVALDNLGRSEEAIASYNRALEIDPTDAATHYNMGNALWKLGRSEEAIASYRRALEIDPTDAATHQNMGVALDNLGRSEEAIASYNRALEIDPKKASAHCNIGVALGNLGRFEDAIASFRRALEIDPSIKQARDALIFLSSLAKK